MSILIKDMELPKEGHIFVCIHADGKVYEESTEYAGIWEEFATAVPIQPHGRLIDADELKKKHHWTDDFYETEYVEVEDINAAPTIIPAEEGET